MPVNYTATPADQIFPVPGVCLGVTQAGIRKANRLDLTLITLAAESTVAGVFTQNRFCAAPVRVCRAHLSSGKIRALVINTGIANAGTGAAGMAAAHATCAAAANLLALQPEQVLPFSTGVIMEPLPVERLIAGLPQAQAGLHEAGWPLAAQAIMTTDTVYKAASRRITINGHTVTLTGIAKGAGMIRPNMATMLGFIATDAGLPPTLMQTLLTEVADASFNCISVDGDTSTNDSLILMASGQSPVRFADAIAPGFAAFKAALTEIARELAQAIVRDGEGASKFIRIRVAGGRDGAECKAAGYAIAHSPLVKTAFFASDPNLGRMLAAIGNSGIADLDDSTIRLWLGSLGEEVLVAEQGGCAPGYREADGARIMQSAEIDVRVDLGRGNAQAEVWTCDLSHDYVKINADYRS